MLTERQPFDLELNEYIFLNLQKVFFVAEFFFFSNNLLFFQWIFLGIKLV